MNDRILAIYEPLKELAERDFFPWVIETIVIETPEQLKNMSDLLGVGKAMVKKIEAARVQAKKPALEYGALVDKTINPLKNRVELGVSRIDQAVLLYHKKAKQEADALLVMQMKENTGKLVESRETGEVYEPAELITKPVGQTIRGNMSTTSVIEGWDYQIIDEALVERSLCSPDMVKIRARHKSGVAEIPGVLITPKSHTATRLG